jgi:hypothetical protein
MTASDNLSSQLFHGTIENLKPGDIVRPRTPHGTAWASSNIHAVVEHTQDRIWSGLGQDDHNKSVDHGNVYEVEKLPWGHYNDKPLTATSGAVGSETGFIVKSHVASVLKRK